MLAITICNVEGWHPKKFKHLKKILRKLDKVLFSYDSYKVYPHDQYVNPKLVDGSLCLEF